MSTLADLVRGGRKKQIDEAVESPAPTQAVAPAPARKEEAPQSSSGPAKEKWDDYLQQWVPKEKWMSPQEHRKKEAGGFVDAAKGK